MEHSIYDHVVASGLSLAGFKYHVEDGQFSSDFSHGSLLCKEGDIFEFDERRIYVLYIDGKHVECIGDIERRFPKSLKEHFDLKYAMVHAYQQYEECHNAAIC